MKTEDDDDDDDYENNRSNENNNRRRCHCRTNSVNAVDTICIIQNTYLHIVYVCAYFIDN